MLILMECLNNCGLNGFVSGYMGVDMIFARDFVTQKMQSKSIFYVNLTHFISL